jgi:hypothetical protein
MNTTMLHETCHCSTRRGRRRSMSEMNVLPLHAPRQLAHVHSAEEGSTDAGEDERRHGDAAEDDSLVIPCSTTASTRALTLRKQHRCGRRCSTMPTRSQINVLQHYAPQQVAHAHAAYKGSTCQLKTQPGADTAKPPETRSQMNALQHHAPRDAAADERHHAPRDAAEDERHHDPRDAAAN